MEETKRNPPSDLCQTFSSPLTTNLAPEPADLGERERVTRGFVATAVAADNSVTVNMQKTSGGGGRVSWDKSQ